MSDTTDRCAACALLEPAISGVVPLAELIPAGIAAGIAIAMAGGGVAAHLCEPHQLIVGGQLNDAVEAATENEDPL